MRKLHIITLEQAIKQGSTPDQMRASAEYHERLIKSGKDAWGDKLSKMDIRYHTDAAVIFRRLAHRLEQVQKPAPAKQAA